MLISSLTLSSGYATLTIPLASPLSAAIGALPERSSNDIFLSDLQPITLTGLQINPFNSTPELEPHCFSLGRFLAPIANPSDCDRAITNVLNEVSDPSRPVPWADRETWSSGTSNIVLRSRGLRSLGMFSKDAIAYDAQTVKAQCVTASAGFTGGSVPVWNHRRLSCDV
ncbi:hypothetical protein N7G274_010450 [Stereocaulon virgatum]|uniref:Uncharacterized protein n=1 Tax=Stereocaulon virgatum TaxID=373712 RepID=A0ABR3ZTH8_9LECA